MLQWRFLVSDALVGSLLGKLLSFPSDPKEKSELVELLRREDELADFLRFVEANDLRAEAFEALEKRLGNS
jgi:hypothetical protein